MVTDRLYTMMEKKMQRGLKTSLPYELIEEILSRCPAKTLLRFLCVSKEWLRLISSPSLKQLHHDRNSQRFILAVDIPPSRSPTLYVMDLLDGKLLCQFKLSISYSYSPYSSFICSGSSHGLVFFSDQIATSIHVCNPTTHELVRLPEPVSISSRGRKLRPLLGMGFLPESNTYKFVLCFFDRKIKESWLEVLALTDGREPRSSHWRIVENKYKCCRVNNRRKVLDINGVIYWALIHPVMVGELSGLVAFDLRTEECKTIQLPAQVIFDEYRTDMVELRGTLCLAKSITIPYHNREETDIWVLSEEEEWVHRYKFYSSLSHLITWVPASAGDQMCGKGEEEENLELVFMKERYSNMDLHYYNIKEKTISVIRSEEPSSQKPWIHGRAHVYFDTMFSFRPSLFYKE